MFSPLLVRYGAVYSLYCFKQLNISSKYPFHCVEISYYQHILHSTLSHWRSSLILTMRYIQRSGDNCQQLVLKLELEPGVICYSCLQSPAPSLNGSCHSGNEDLMITHHHHLSDGKQNISNSKISKQGAGQLWCFCVEMFRSVMFQLQIGPFLIYGVMYRLRICK